MNIHDLRTTAKVLSQLVLASTLALYAFVAILELSDRNEQLWATWIILFKPYHFRVSAIGVIAGLYLMMSNGRTGRKWPGRSFLGL